VSAEKAESMEVEGKVIDPKTMRDQLGNYPEWFSQKRIKRMKRSHKRQQAKKQKNKRH
jgi:hypothetical protein